MKNGGQSGDMIHFGGYDWRVLAIKDDMMLVVSEKILSARAYHSANVEITWENSDMRRYLNGAFYDNTFSEEEKCRIVESKLDNNDNPEYRTAGGNDTIDKVFLLSLAEAEQNFTDNSARTALTTIGEDSHWWLRSPGCEPTSAAYVEYDGVVCYGFGHWSGIQSSGGVRPAIWLNL